MLREDYHQCDIVRAAPVRKRDAAGKLRRLRCDTVLTCVRVAAFVILAAFFLVAHGCHADEDTELFAPFVEWLKVSPSPPTPLPKGEGG